MTRPPTSTAEGEVFEVFAKFLRDEPLHHVGNVVAGDPELATVYAYTLYDEWGWSQMIIVPRKEIVTLLAPG